MNTTCTSENVSVTPACLGLGRIARLPLTPARGFWLALSLLAAALWCAPSPAAAHTSSNTHGHFNISLTPSTITEGQTTTVSYSYIGPNAVVHSGNRGNRYATAYIQLSKSAASPTGGGAVNFSANTRWSWQTYLENRHDNSLGSGNFNGNASGTVTITPVDDSNATGTRTVTVTGTLPIGTQDYFYGVGDGEFVISTATLTILDNDVAIEVSRGTGALALTEGDNATHTVTLAGQPTGAVVVDVTSDDAGAVAVAPAALTFSATTWNTGQAVTVRAVSDADSDAETVTVTHAVDDANSADEFDPAPDVTFMVNVTDRNPEIVVSRGTGALALTEYGDAAYTVTLTQQPSGAVVVDVTSDDAGAVAVAPAALTFSATTWNTGQAVTVRAVSDADSDAETVTVTHAVNDANSADEFDPAPDVTFTVNVTDRNTPRSTFAASGIGTNIHGVSGGVPAVAGTRSITLNAVNNYNWGVLQNFIWACTKTVTPTTQDLSYLASGCTRLSGGGSGDRTTTTRNLPITQTMIDNGGFVLAVRTEIRIVYAAWVPLSTPKTPTLVLSPTSITENGGVSTVTATLSSAPTAAVTLTVAAAAVSPAVAGDFTLSAAAMLTFAASATTSTGTVTLTAVNNAVFAADKRVTVSGTVASGDGLVVAPADVTLRITDDDSSPLTLLRIQDRTPGRTGNTDFSFSPACCSGTAYTATVPATVTAVQLRVNAGSAHQIHRREGLTGNFSAGTDADHTLSTTGATVIQVQLRDGPTTVLQTFTVTIYKAGVAVGAVSGQATEAGGTATFTVRLTGPPSANVRIGVSSGDSGEGRVAPAALDFTTTTWNTAQTVTVTGVDDSVPDGTQTWDVDLGAPTSADGSYSGLAARTVSVTTVDDDTGLAVDPTTLALTEEDATAGSGTYTVALATLPSGPVTVSVTSGDAAVTVSPGALTYGTTNWNTAQTVTATAVHDDDGVGETVTVSHTTTSSDASYTIASARAAESVTVTVTDNDPPGLAVDPTTLALTEEDATAGSGTYTVALAALPSGLVTITATSGNAAVTVTPGTLTYGATNWNTAQPVTATAVHDENGAGETVTVTHAVSGTADTTSYPTTLSLTAADVTVTVTDNDTRAVVVDTDLGTPGLQTTALAVTEEHATQGRAAYTVALGTQPVGGAVTVTITSDGQAVAEPTQLVFTANDWATAQTVTAVAQPDDDGDNASVTLTHTAGGADYPAPPAAVTADVMVTVTDDDQPGLWVSATTLAVAEPGTGTYTVRLNTEPGGAVTVGVADTTSNADVSVSPSALEFGAADWNTAQAVTVTVTADADAADDTATLRHTVTGTADTTAYPTTLAAVEVAVTVADPDTAAVTVSATALAVHEDPTAGGGTNQNVGTYTVVLGTEPTAPVTVTIASDDEEAVSRAPAALTFSTTTWATAQAVTATAVADDDAVDERVTLTHTLTGAAEYAGSAGPPAVAGVTVDAVTVTVEDDEEQGLTLNPTAVTVAEDGAAGTYTVVLDSRPTAPVVVRIGSDNTDVHAMPGLLQYTASNWNTAQPVTVRADADADARADRATLTHTAAGGDYAGLAEQSLPVTVTDTSAGVVVSRQGLTVVMGETNTYTIVLTAQPAGPVTVTVNTSTNGVVAVDTDSTPESRALVFTAGNWQTAQVVTVRGVAVTTSLTLNHRVDGYGGVTAADSVSVVVAATGARLLIDPQVLRVLEGGPSGTYTVRLATDPTGTATVTVGAVSNTNSAVSVSGAPVVLTFTGGATGNWGTAQPVTVTAAREVPADMTAGSALILHTVGGYNGGTTNDRTVEVNEDEDETPTLGAVTPQTYRAGQAVSVRLPGATGGNPPLRYALTGPLPATDLTLPAGLAFAAETRRLQGTPGAAAAAATYTLTVTDVNGSTATQTFALTVADNPLPGFTAAVPFMRHPLNQAAEQTLPAPTNMDNRDLTFVVTPGLPAGLRYVPPMKVGGAYATGGQIVGTPTAATPQRQYRLTVVDAQGNEAAVTFALATGAAPAAPGPADRQPRFGNATVEPQRYTVGTAVTLALPAATNGDGRLTYTLEPAELPAGLTYTPPAAGDTTGGTLAGTPTAVHPATTYTLTATDADGDPAELAFTVEVGAAGAIRPQDGTQTYTVNGQQVTVTQAPGTLAGIALTVTEPARLDGAVTITLAPPGADMPVVRGGYGFGPAGARAVVALTVTPVPAGGLRVCLPVPAEVRTAAGERALVLVRYTGQQWEPVAGAEDDAAAGQVCAAGMTAFGPLGVGYANRVPTFEDRPVGALALQVNEAHAVPLPAATGGDGAVRYTLTPPALPAGLTYTPPAAGAATGGVIAGTPAAETAARGYTLTATDVDGDTAELPFTLEVVRTPVRVTVTDATAVEGRPVEFAVTLSRAAGGPLTLGWTAGRPGSATPGEDYEAVAAGQVTVAAGATAGTLVVPTLDDRRVEPVETFTVTVTLPAETSIELAQGTAAGRIEDDDTEQARQRSLGMVLAGVGRTLATDAVDVIGDRFVRPPSAAQATVGGQAVDLERGPQRGRWRHAAGVAYGVARALGVEVGSPLEGGDGQFGQVRGAAWSTLTRHLRDPHAPTPPLSAWDAPGAFASAPGPGWNGPSAAGWGNPHATGEAPSIPPPPSTFRQAQGTASSGTTGRGLEPAPDLIRGDGSSAGQSLAGDSHFGPAPFPGLAGYGPGLGQLGFDRVHAATPQAVQVGALQAPVQFRRVSGAEVLSQSEFELPLSGPASPADPPPAASVAEADPAATDPLVEPAAQAAAATWTLWGRGTASGFNGKPKDDFSMDGNVFTGYLGVDYRLQPNVLVGLAVAHSQGDVDYETADVTKGDVDVTLTSVLPYAHWSPRPGLGVWGLFGAGWGDLKLRDEAGKVKTDLEMLLGAVGARQEVLTWRRIDVALKADAFLTELEAGADDRLPETAGDAQRLRLMLEGRTAWAVSEDSHLTPVFEVGGRWDGGKAETGVGAEMGGGFEYAHTKLGLGIEARGRYLLAHQKSAFDEWGASLTLRLDPGADKRGLWLALAPVWGAEASQVEQMWGSADVLRATGETDTPPGFSPAQVEFDVGYGMVTHEGLGLLTTYGGLSMLGPESHGVRLGGRLALGEWIDLSVEGERTTQGGGADHQVALYGHLGW